MIKILFADDSRSEFEPFLRANLARWNVAAEIIDFEAPHDPAEIDYILYAPSSGLQDFTPYTRTKAVLSLWAGVEKIVGNTSLTQPLARMVDPGMTESMVEYVVGHSLRHHLGMDAHLQNPARLWVNEAPKMARHRPVTILGFGALGQACARALQALAFPVTGWSRTPKTVEGLTSLSGAAGLRAALQNAEIVITLLPRTPETENILNAETLAWLPRGASIINPGRGPLIDDAALLAALDTGHISHATLDVFRVEPLPQDHPYWAHPKVTVTPHIAAMTRHETAAEVLAENIHRAETGAPLLHRVDRSRGY